MESNKRKYNNKEIILKIIDVFLVLGWMTLVFWFSSQVGDDSKVQSGNTIRKIVLLFNKDITAENLELIVETLQPFVRKLAHFSLYTLGGILIYNLINKYNLNKKAKIVYTIIIGALYATSDEIHQLFVPYRSGQITDVLIDTSGVITGVILFIIIAKIKNFIIKKIVN